jgi:predicted esterase
VAGLSDSPRIQVHGFSQGTATACRWVAFGRHRVHRLVLWGGGVPPDLPLERHRAALTRAGLTLAIGSRDKHIGAGEVGSELARLAAAGITPAVHRFDGGHRVDGATLRALDEEG